MKEILRYCDEGNIPYEFCGRLMLIKSKPRTLFRGVLAIVAQPDVMIDDLLDGTPIICLDGVKTRNLGTIIRTADWFGVKTLFCPKTLWTRTTTRLCEEYDGIHFRVNIFESEGW